MAEVSHDIDVEIEPDPAVPEVEVVPPEPEKKAKKKDAEPEPKAEPEEDPAIATLKAQVDAAKAEKAASDRRAAEALEREAQAKGQTQDSQLQTLEAHLTTTKQSMDVLKANLADAMQQGDFAAAADAQASLAIQASRLTNLETGIEQARARPKPQAQVQQIDQVEYIARQLSPQSAAWVRAHPQYAREDHLFKRMVKAHELTMDNGIQIDTPAYFQSVESMLGIGQPIETNGAVREQPVERRSAPPAAPVSRETTTLNGDNRRVVRLSADQREMARNMDMSDKDYARYLIQIEEDKAAGRVQ